MTAGAKHRSPAKAAHEGPLDWRSLVEWLRADGVIAEDEAKRTDRKSVV